METRSVRLRRAFSEASRFVMDLADGIDESRWGDPGVGDWTVAELCVHISRAGSTISDYAAEPAERTVMSSTDYYLVVLADASIHSAVAERTKAQAAEVSEPIPEFLRSVFEQAEQTMQRTPSSAVLGSRAGGITLEDYLPTRVTELVVHGIDLADALGCEPEVPATAMAVTLETLADLSMHRPDVLAPADVVRALTGRGNLPDATNVLG
ncbi:MAG: maleylpyruvate isomerase N-terminal domain-containing protein [Microthrixaceae bacterium]|nr:maleylpyruvate isomerase N-terminal domain-containing protein [Microthrixaceae bacterium]MCB9386753.1 maleylpyruvate isomerase N-terminal domain-containing protein [Microthrixaceae bacterium]